MRNFFRRPLPPVRNRLALRAGVGGVIAIAALLALTQHSGVTWLMAPFGASCVLLFSAPGSALSQPANVVFGHLVATAIGLIAAQWLPAEPWVLAVAVGVAIATMARLRVTHPPAGADPLVVLLAQPGWDFLLSPVAAGAIVLVLIAWGVHRLPGGVRYPASG